MDDDRAMAGLGRTEIAWTLSDGAKGGDTASAHTGRADETSDADPE